ncbi:MarR family transcriptional regulator [Nitrosopumilus sp.]|uniref:MarR family winged helix-turn-helix transcriptional regulator n=1 Tax=Nitrosopumilus sp. TaxID=2024843 RepID=UPI00247E6F6D|nr:MarR family transcriptional regulator [Nitrosopumilus sp.]MCV0409244.1 MarR family transcriptional regulator [Nitrosopumilus sp.]
MKTLDLKDSIGLMMKRSAKAWERAADIELTERFGLTGGKWKVITGLSINEGITQKQLADMMFVEAPTLVPIIDKLEKEGYLTRQSDPKDRRNNLIFLTKKAKKTVDPIIDCIVKMRDIGLDKISKKDLEITKKTLTQINANAEAFIMEKGKKTEPDVWTNPQNKSQKTLVKV